MTEHNNNEKDFVVNFPFTIERNNAIPLDKTSVFKNKKDADEYLNSNIAYDGQVIAVTDDEFSIYALKNDSLEKLEFTKDVDAKIEETVSTLTEKIENSSEVINERINIVKHDLELSDNENKEYILGVIAERTEEFRNKDSLIDYEISRINENISLLNDKDISLEKNISDNKKLINSEVTRIEKVIQDTKTTLEIADADNKAELTKIINDNNTAITNNLNTQTQNINKEISFLKDKDISLENSILEVNELLTSEISRLEQVDIDNKDDIIEIINETKQTLLEKTEELETEITQNISKDLENIQNNILDINNDITNINSSISSMYTNEEIDTKFTDVDQTISNMYTKEEVDDIFNKIDFDGVESDIFNNLVEEIDSLKKGIYTKEEIDSTIEGLNTSINENIVTTNSAISNINTEISLNKENISNNSTEIANIKNSIYTKEYLYTKEELNESLEKIETNEDNLEIISGQFEIFRTDLGTAQENISNLQTHAENVYSKTEIDNSLNSITTKLNTATTTISSLSDTVTNNFSEVTSITSNITNRIDGVENSISATKEEILETVYTKEETNSIKEDLETSISTTKSNIDTDILSLTNDLTMVSNEFSDFKINNGNSIDEINSYLNKLKSNTTLASYNIQDAYTKEDVDLKILSEITTVTNRIDDINEEVLSLQNTTNSELEANKSLINSVDSKVTNLNSSIFELSENISEIDEKVSLMENEYIMYTNSQVNALKGNVSSEYDTLEKIEDKISDSLSSISEINSKKQDKLIPGQNVTIDSNNEISVSIEITDEMLENVNLSNYVTNAKFDEEIETKQDKFSIGENLEFSETEDGEVILSANIENAVKTIHGQSILGEGDIELEIPSLEYIGGTENVIVDGIITKNGVKDILKLTKYSGDILELLSYNEAGIKQISTSTFNEIFSNLDDETFNSFKAIIEYLNENKDLVNDLLASNERLNVFLKDAEFDNPDEGIEKIDTLKEIQEYITSNETKISEILENIESIQGNISNEVSAAMTKVNAFLEGADFDEGENEYIDSLKDIQDELTSNDTKLGNLESIVSPLNETVSNFFKDAEISNEELEINAIDSLKKIQSGISSNRTDIDEINSKIENFDFTESLSNYYKKSEIDDKFDSTVNLTTVRSLITVSENSDEEKIKEIRDLHSQDETGNYRTVSNEADLRIQEFISLFFGNTSENVVRLSGGNISDYEAQ